MGYKTDIEIAQECEMKPITEIAAKAPVPDHQNGGGRGGHQGPHRQDRG